MDRLLSMEVFVAAVDHGSLTAAAARFAMTPPMAGKHVRALEERLGVRLLQRTTRRQRLTEIGAQYYAECKRILDDIRAVESSAESMRSAPRGQLRVTAPVSLGSLRVASLVPEYLSRHPEVRVDLSLSDHVVDLVQEGFDLAIRMGDLADSRLVSRPLAPYRMLICASPEYLARAGRPRTPDDLVKHQCLGFTHWTRRRGWELGRSDVKAGGLPVPRFTSNNGQALRVAALSGAGIVLQPEVLLGDDVASKKLVPILEDFLPPPLPVRIVYPRDRTPVPKVTAFIDLVLARLGPSRAKRTRPRS